MALGYYELFSVCAGVTSWEMVWAIPFGPIGGAMTKLHSFETFMPVAVPSGHNLSTQSGAQIQADRIRAFWRKHGYSWVDVWVEPTPMGVGDRSYNLYGVRSNLVDGCPPRRET